MQQQPRFLESQLTPSTAPALGSHPALQHPSIPAILPSFCLDPGAAPGGLLLRWLRGRAGLGAEDPDQSLESRLSHVVQLNNSPPSLAHPWGTATGICAAAPVPWDEAGQPLAAALTPVFCRWPLLSADLAGSSGHPQKPPPASPGGGGFAGLLEWQVNVARMPSSEVGVHPWDHVWFLPKVP